MNKNHTRFSVLSLLLITATALAGCSQNVVNNESLSSATNIPQSGIVELKNGDTYEMSAEYITKEINGQAYKMLAYNGSIPGPTLKVPQGAEITVNLKNNTDIPTSLHSHGVRLEDKFDGVVDVQQPAIDPGQIFTYKIKFPDAGMFWYHPHLNEPYTQSHGLYGNYWVVPSDKNYWSPVNEEIPLALNDLRIQNNRLDSFNPKVTNYALMGEFGNTLFVNGESAYKKTFQSGAVARFYITNASNARPYNLAIPNVKMKLVGGDNGRYEREAWQDYIVLSPSERAIVEVLFDQPGTFMLQNANPQHTYTLATFEVTEQKVDQSFSKEFETLRENTDVIADIAKYRDAFDKAPDKNISLTMSMSDQGQMGMMGSTSSEGMMMSGEGMNHSSLMGNDEGPIEWEDTMAMMNAMSTTDTIKWKIVDEETKKENHQIDWKFKVGDQVKIKIFNDPKSMHPMQHPIHFHGQRFLVLSADGVKNTNLVWKDTVLVPKGATVEILVEMSNPGKWMAHCHIAEHLSSGMMFPFEVLTSDVTNAKTDSKVSVDEAIFAVNQESNSISVVDAKTLKEVSRVAGLFSEPHNIQLSPDRNMLWVTNGGNDTVTVLDGHTLKELATIKVGMHPAHVVLTPDNQTAIVTNAGDNNLSVIDARTYTVTDTIPVGNFPHGLRLNNTGTIAYVADYKDGALDIVDLQQKKSIGKVVAGGAQAVQVAVDDRQKEIYLSLGDLKSIAVIDATSQKVKSTISVMYPPAQLYLTPDGAYVVVAEQGAQDTPGDQVSFINTRTKKVDFRVNTDKGPHGVFIAPDGKNAYVTNMYANTISQIDLEKKQVVATSPVGALPNGITGVAKQLTIDASADQSETTIQSASENGKDEHGH